MRYAQETVKALEDHVADVDNHSTGNLTPICFMGLGEGSASFKRWAETALELNAENRKLAAENDADNRSILTLQMNLEARTAELTAANNTINNLQQQLAKAKQTNENLAKMVHPENFVTKAAHQIFSLARFIERNAEQVGASSAEDSRIIADALNNPTQPNDAMKRAFEQHAERVVGQPQPVRGTTAVINDADMVIIDGKIVKNRFLVPVRHGVQVVNEGHFKIVFIER